MSENEEKALVVKKVPEKEWVWRSFEHEEPVEDIGSILVTKEARKLYESYPSDIRVLRREIQEFQKLVDEGNKPERIDQGGEGSIFVLNLTEEETDSGVQFALKEDTIKNSSEFLDDNYRAREVMESDKNFPDDIKLVSYYGVVSSDDHFSHETIRTGSIGDDEWTATVGDESHPIKSYLAMEYIEGGVNLCDIDGCALDWSKSKNTKAKALVEELHNLGLVDKNDPDSIYRFTMENEKRINKEFEDRGLSLIDAKGFNMLVRIEEDKPIFYLVDFSIKKED